MNPEEYASAKLAALENEAPASADDAPAKSKCTGPKTEAGKKRSAINATTHGLSGRVVVLPSEDMALYLAQSKELVDSLDPQTPIERKLAQTVADGYWRMERFRTVEESMFAWGHYEPAGDFDAENEKIHSAFTAAAAFRTNPQAFATLSIYEQRIQRGIEKAMKQLQELQATRKQRQAKEMEEAINLYQFDKMRAASAEQPETSIEAVPRRSDGRGESGEQLILEQSGRSTTANRPFVCSSQEIEAEIRRRERRHNAWLASTVDFDYKEYLAKAA